MKVNTEIFVIKKENLASLIGRTDKWYWSAVATKAEQKRRGAGGGGVTR